jgi:hypothetical protein
VLANITAVSRLHEARRGLEAKAASSPVAGKMAASLALLLGPLLAAAPALGWAAPVPRQTPPMLSYPVPTGVENQLFYLQRDPNTNTVIYQLNVDKGGRLNTDEPVHAFWIRYADQGERKELNFIQRKFAYGLTAKQLAPEKYVLKFVAYDKVPLYLMKWPIDNAYHVFATLHNRQVVLSRIYLRIEGGTFWVPNVKYIELKGQNATTREPVVERLAV